MDNVDKLYDIIKRDDFSLERLEILKDIIIIDGAIVMEDDIEYKKDTLNESETKYGDILYRFGYERSKEFVEEKIESTKTSLIKDINTKLGTLKVWLIRIAGYESLISEEKKDRIDNYLKSIDKAYNSDEFYTVIDELDTTLVKYLE